MKYTSVLCAVFLLAGCSVSDRDLAAQGDWYQIGYQDGIAGHNARTNKDLNKLGVVQQSEYDSGYLDGVKEYCNPAVAYQIGLSGQYYEGACEGTDQAQRFRMEWQRGWEDYNSKN